MRIGVSGHQEIRPDHATPWIEQQIRESLIRFNATVGISCLAAGSDQIFAFIVTELGLKLEVVLPSKEYELSFHDQGARKNFIKLLKSSNFTNHIEFEHPSEEAFLLAGRKVVDISDAMIFIWDGKPAKGLGGTEEIVHYAQSLSRPYIWLNPLLQKVNLAGL